MIHAYDKAVSGGEGVSSVHIKRIKQKLYNLEWKISQGKLIHKNYEWPSLWTKSVKKTPSMKLVSWHFSTYCDGLIDKPYGTKFSVLWIFIWIWLLPLLWWWEKIVKIIPRINSTWKHKKNVPIHMIEILLVFELFRCTKFSEIWVL